jgi:hypothetical protein
MQVFRLRTLRKMTPNFRGRRDLVTPRVPPAPYSARPFAIIAQAMRAILLANAMATILAGLRANTAASQGRCLVPWILA